MRSSQSLLQLLEEEKLKDEGVSGEPAGVIPKTTAAPAVEPPPSPWLGIGEVTGPGFYGQMGITEPAPAIEEVIKVAETLDKPYNALRVMAYDTAKTTHEISRKLGVPKSIAAYIPSAYTLPEAGTPVEALRKGWRGEVYKSWGDVRNVAALGPEMEERLNNWMDRHWYLKAIKFADHFVTDVAIEAGMEALLFAGIVKAPVGALISRAPKGAVSKVAAKVTPGYYSRQVTRLLRSKKAPRPFFSDNFMQWMDRMVRRNAGMDLDDALLHSIGTESIQLPVHRVEGLPQEIYERIVKGREIPEAIAPRLKNVVDDIATERSKTEWLHQGIELNKARIAEQLDPEIEKADFLLKQIESSMLPDEAKIEAASRRLDDLYITKEHLIEQITNSYKDIDAAESKIRALETGQFYDYQGLSRAIRTQYIDDMIGAAPDTSFKKEIADAANAVSLGRTEALEELSDNEFLALFDYVEMLKQAPDSFKYERIKPSFFKKRTLPGAPPFADWITPSWMYFRRMGVPKIAQVAEQADVEATSHILRVLNGWDGHLKRIGKDEDTMRRVFWVANDEMDKFAGEIKAGVITEARGDLEEAAGRYINDAFAEIADMFEAQGRWPEKLKRQEYYIRNIVKRGVEEAPPEDIGRMFAAYDKIPGLKINIPEWKNRVLHDLPIVENADAGLKAGLYNEVRKLKWEPTLTQMNTMAKFTGNDEIIEYTTNFINYAIRGRMTPLEKRIEPAFEKLGKVFEKLPLLHFETQDRAARQILAGWRRLNYHGAMWANPGPIAKNVTQTLLNIPQAGYRSWWWGMQSIWSEGGQTLANKHCRLLVGRVPLEEFDVRSFKGFAELGHRGFRFVDRVPNIKAGFNGDCHYLIRRNSDYVDIVRKYGKFDSSDVTGSAAAISKAFDAGELPHVKEAANFMVKTAQFGYRAFDMPRYMWQGGPLAKALFQFTSWPANYFYSYLPEVAKYSLTGIGPGGITLKGSERLGLMKHYFNSYALFAAGKAMGVDMSRHLPPGPREQWPGVGLGGAAPTGPGPFGTFLQGLVDTGIGANRGSQRQVEEGVRTMKSSITFLPPLFAKRGYRAYKESSELRSLYTLMGLRPEPEEERKLVRPKRPSLRRKEKKTLLDWIMQ